MNNTDKLLEEQSENICLLTLVAFGRLPRAATYRDAIKHFWAIKEDCENCPCKEKCLVMIYTKNVKL